MKFLILLFSVYLLALNAFPCADSAVVTVNAGTALSFNSDVEHGMGDQDLCPLFCSCHCCHVHSVELSPVDDASLHTEMIAQLFAHRDSLSEKYIYSLLDPPQV